jgi:hypothetical protein
MWNDSQCIPTICCPWGCSAYLSEANNVSFDFLVEIAMERPTQTYSVNSERLCTRAWRRDLFSKDTYHFMNPEWECLPSVMFISGKGPKILTCQYHNKCSRSEYIHMPTNPTRNISFESDNFVAPVMTVSRTMQSMKSEKLYKFVSSQQGDGKLYRN